MTWTTCRTETGKRRGKETWNLVWKQNYRLRQKYAHISASLWSYRTTHGKLNGTVFQNSIVIITRKLHCITSNQIKLNRIILRTLHYTNETLRAMMIEKLAFSVFLFQQTFRFSTVHLKFLYSQRECSRLRLQNPQLWLSVPIDFQHQWRPEITC